MIDRRIFRQYDIRGTFGRDLTLPAARAIGWAFGTLCRERTGKAAPTVAVGMDSRLSSPALAAAFRSGLARTQARSLDLGLVPTPATYFAAHHLGCDGFTMVTGSHNPPAENGFKLGIGKAALHGEEVTLLGQTASRAPGGGEGEGWPESAGEPTPILPAYADELVRRFPALPGTLAALGRPVRVAIDSGNGTAGIVLPEVLRRIGFSVTELYSEPDGNFPHHHPDPTLPQTLEALRTAVSRGKADLGMAFDGDADRLGVVDGAGGVVWGDMLLLLLARDLIAERRRSGGKPPLVISEVKASQVLYDEVARAGGKPLMWKTGHSLIKAKMRETGAEIAGEMSGHLFFADRWFGFDDALYAALRVLEVYAVALAEGRARAFADLLADVPRVSNTPELRFEVPEDDKARIVAAVAGRVGRHREGGGEPRVREVLTIDGIRVVFDRGWALLRASNTQPVLVMRVEAADGETLAAYRSFLEGHLAAARGEEGGK